MDIVVYYAGRKNDKERDKAVPASFYRGPLEEIQLREQVVISTIETPVLLVFVVLSPIEHCRTRQGQ